MISKIGQNNFKASISTQLKKTKSIHNIKKTRVEEIKKQIEIGKYKIDLDKTAKAFAKHLL